MEKTARRVGRARNLLAFFLFKMTYTTKELMAISGDLGKIQALLDSNAGLRKTLVEMINEHYKPALVNFMNWLMQTGYMDEGYNVESFVDSYLEKYKPDLK